MENSVDVKIEEWKLEEISTIEFETFSNELLAWCGFFCSGKGGTGGGN